MRVTLEAADAIGLQTEACEEFRRLLGLGTAEFIKEQLAAVSLVRIDCYALCVCVLRYLNESVRSDAMHPAGNIYFTMHTDSVISEV